jgi:hypothetical protein
MLSFFTKKSKAEQLEEEYLSLTQKAFKLEQSNSAKAHELQRKAQLIMLEIVKLNKQTGVLAS